MLRNQVSTYQGMWQSRIVCRVHGDDTELCLFSVLKSVETQKFITS